MRKILIFVRFVQTLFRGSSRVAALFHFILFCRFFFCFLFFCFRSALEFNIKFIWKFWLELGKLDNVLMNAIQYFVILPFRESVEIFRVGWHRNFVFVARASFLSVYNAFQNRTFCTTTNTISRMTFRNCSSQCRLCTQTVFEVQWNPFLRTHDIKWLQWAHFENKLAFSPEIRPENACGAPFWRWHCIVMHQNWKKQNPILFP